MNDFAWLCIGVAIGAFIGWHAGYMRRLRDDQEEWRADHYRQMAATQAYGNRFQ